MTTTPRTENASESDSNLWQLVCQGSTSAFEVLVRRHQSLVCAVAYSACGNLALSEDVAQETFWTAWRQRASLEQPDRLKAWLCGIARNLAKNARRKASRPVESAESLDVLDRAVHRRCQAPPRKRFRGRRRRSSGRRWNGFPRRIASL